MARVASIKHQGARSLGIGRGEQEAHWPALGNGKQSRMFTMSGIRDRTNVVHAVLQVRDICHAIRQTGPTLVEKNQSRKCGETREKICPRGSHHSSRFVTKPQPPSRAGRCRRLDRRSATHRFLRAWFRVGSRSSPVYAKVQCRKERRDFFKTPLGRVRRAVESPNHSFVHAIKSRKLELPIDAVVRRR
jgi:hypothetical protein